MTERGEQQDEVMSLGSRLGSSLRSGCGFSFRSAGASGGGGRASKLLLESADVLGDCSGGRQVVVFVGVDYNSVSR